MATECPPDEPTKKPRPFYVVFAVAVLLVVLIVGVVFFTLSNIGQDNHGPGPFDVEVATDKLFYLQGEDVLFSIYVNNPQNWSVPTPFELSYEIKEDDRVIYDASVPFEPLAGSIPTYPAHSRVLSSTYTWNQTINVDGNLTLVQPGSYTFMVTFDGPVDYGNGGNCTFEIRAKP